MKYIGLYLAAVLLLCLAPMPYGYFTLVRILATVVFGLYAYRCYVAKKEGLTWVFVTLALLFQPFAKVGLGRTVWNVIDVIVAIGLIALFIWEWNKNKIVEKGKTPIPPNSSIKIENVEDNRIEFKLEGKLAPKELIYVASEEDKALTDLFETNPEVFEGWGQMIGFHIIYLPLLMKRLADKNVLQYRAPYLSETELARTAIGNDFLLQYLEHPGERGRIKHGFIRTENIHRGGDGKDKAINRFYPLSSIGAEPIADQLHRIGKQISEERIQQERLLENKYEGYDEWGDGGSTGADDHFNSQKGEENIDDLIEEVKERIAKLRQRGISQYILEQLIHPDDRLSRLVITKDYRLLLPDYNDMEIKMEPLVKAVYLLFLKHPEGIMFKCLPDYRQELAQIYVKLKPYGMSERVVQSIEDVTNPLLNSINEKCARIRGAFVGQFDDHMARHYYIDGLRGEAKKIDLPRNLVVWE
jgi:hypothetical protein